VSRRRDIGAQYNAARGGGLTDRVSTFMRRRMYARFMAAGVAGDDYILDVGVTSDREQLASNYLEAWHPRKDRITACGIDDASTKVSAAGLMARTDSGAIAYSAKPPLSPRLSP
jgi:hypothetical protein